jgi:hypothetical protein
MSQTAILLPLLGLVGLTFGVWIFLYVQRLTELRVRRIDPQALSRSAQRNATLENTSGADNFRNLLELPVLFYVLCLVLLATGSVTAEYVYGAWAYVALRALHSAIHCTYNRVVHRFTAYVLSSLLLFGMWGAYALETLR